MKKKTVLALLLALTMLAATFTACGAAESEAADTEGYATEDLYVEAPSFKEESVEEEMVMTEDSASNLQYSTTTGGTENGTATEVDPNQYADKIIYSGHSHVETTEFDATVQALEKSVTEFGGFVQDSNISGSTRKNSDGTTVVVDRWGYYVVRIPSARFDEFMTMTEGIGNVISSGRTAENVTSQYTDYEARLSSLKTQEERLLAMLEESGDLESLIALEARLSEVRYEIESIERNLRDLDQRLSFSTVSVEVQEVEIYTPTTTVQRSFGDKVSDAFGDSWKNFGRGAQSFAIWVVYSLPTLLILAVVCIAGLVTISKVRKAHKKQKTEETTEE